MCDCLYVCLKKLATPRALTLRTSEAGILALRKLPCGLARRYTGFAQTSLWCRKPEYRRTVCQRQASNAGIPALFCNVYWHLNARVIEIQTRQQLKNNLCILTSSGQRTS